MERIVKTLGWHNYYNDYLITDLRFVMTSFDAETHLNPVLYSMTDKSMTDNTMTQFSTNVEKLSTNVETFSTNVDKFSTNVEKTALN